MADENLTPVGEFVKALRASADEFAVNLEDDDVSRLADYYEQTMRWNARLHLVAPCSPAEFATRHVLESLLALQFLPHAAHVVDVGSGAGLPLIPCMIVRPDIKAVLVESSQKKAIFLREALRRAGRSEMGEVLAERFERLAAPRADALTCRAIERFTEIFPTLVEWSAGVKRLLLFGGNSLRERIAQSGLQFSTLHVPRSRERFLFVVERAV